MTLIEEVEAAAAAFRPEPIEVIPFSLYRLYDETGDRLRFQESYFSRRRRLVALALAAWLGRAAADFAALEDAIWAICDEFSWALPAHLGGRSLDVAALDENETCLDLFSCETAFALAEIIELLRADLSAVVAARAAGEIKRRVLLPFVSRREPWNWELMRNNWCAVCAGSVGAAALDLYEDGAALDAILSRVLPTLDRFLDSFADDGACLEGLGYWTYGVGFFTAFADLLLKRTAGRIDLLAKAKFRRIAAFQGAAYLNEDLAVSFADGDARERYRPGLSAYLARRFPESRLPPASLAATLADDPCGRWALSYRDLLWTESPEPQEAAALSPAMRSSGSHCAAPDNGSADSSQAGPYWFPHAQWLICPARKRDDFAFAAKGGNNDEPHNHNDVGSFILVCGKDELVADLGAGEYVKDYFNENRYTIFCCSSESHNVPIVNGRPQSAGAERRAQHVEYRRIGGTSILTMDLTAAYADPSLRQFKRRLEFADSLSLLVVDEFSFDRPDFMVVERFVTRCAIDLTDGGAIIQGLRSAVLVDADGVCPRLSEHVHREHDGRESTILSLDFTYEGKGDSGEALTLRYEFRPLRRS